MKLFMYWFSFVLTKKLGKGNEAWSRLFVKAGNRYFRDQFRKAPYNARVLFLPFCLRSPKCPTVVDREKGLICPNDCSLCRLGPIKRRAEELGYMAAYIVPSSRILPNRGLIPSKEFIWLKIEENKPKAVLGAVCLKDFKRKYMKDTSVSRNGVQSPSKISLIAPQGLLLKTNNCIKNSLDWDKLNQLLVTR